jgi:hypothetical protein
MQALIKHDADSTPIWGFVIFEPKGWKIIENKARPFVFTDAITIEDIDSLSGGMATKMGFQLKKISIEVDG